MITHKDVKYVIVQAGGKGTRLGKYTMNRPKCLVPVYGKPMIEQTLDVYKDKTVIIIGDTHFKMLLHYICEISNSDNYILLQTDEDGTAAGIMAALQNVPDGEPFIITWSDLFFEKQQEFEFDNEMLVGLAGNFDCRWSLENGVFKNIPSQEKGVSGFFAFKNKQRFENLKTDKSLVRGFLSDNYTHNEISSFMNHDCFEVGTVEKYEEILSKEVNHRFFNEVKIEDDKVYKRCIDSKYDKVHQAEKEWYAYVKNDFQRIPKIYSTEPLIMSKVEGKHAWDIKQGKDWIIENYCDALQELHSINECAPNNDYDCADTYMFKPYQRVMQVRHIIEDFSKPVIQINRKSCRNPFCDMRSFEEIMENNLLKNLHYTVIHGDCTFSNTLVDDKNQVWFIDPRGTFGGNKIYGDPRYDWAKLYYSAVGNYDKINSKKFSVDMSNGIKLDIESNGYEHFGEYIIQRSRMTKVEMLLLHAGIWFSLSGYVKEDIDAVLYSFYKGCELWTEAITLI
jgi:GTP:adenosylcobinamide-phosphate guanylyltransferase/aminoglycoside phosphotransferase